MMLQALSRVTAVSVTTRTQHMPCLMFAAVLGIFREALGLCAWM